MGHCRDCKHWGPDEIVATKPAYAERFKICYRLEESEKVHPDADGRGVDVETAPDFGCVLWEGKEAT